VRKIIILVSVAFILLISIFGLLLGWVTIWDSEWQNGAVLKHTNHIADQLKEYKEKNKQYPQTLTEAQINDHYCILKSCFNIKYKVSENRQDYTLASKVNDPFVVYYNYYQQDNNPDDWGGYGIALKENYPPSYSTPSAWPTL